MNRVAFVLIVLVLVHGCAALSSSSKKDTAPCSRKKGDLERLYLEGCRRYTCAALGVESNNCRV